MYFGQDFIDEVRNRTGLAEVVGRRTKLTKRGREFIGLCPFHNEKTPSFTVNEEKGFYHCFGCSAHGNVIDFVVKTEALSFPEAVRKLASLAGLQMPEERPGDREREERSKSLRDVVEVAAGWFESQLASQAGKGARNYIAQRGISPEVAGRFRIGFAPDRNTGLKEALTARGISEDLLKEAGLLGVPDDGRPSYDYFRNRLMFPICDRRGQVIAFGGRALGDARAKYLNSPETPLFHKGNILYNLHLAAPLARDQNTILVTEGYMDVVGLAASGIGHAVAPLGTALTEHQITALWRVVPEPTLCFDGDRAGKAAAYRAAERAVPLLKPGHSLQFVMLPEGEDPDSLVRTQGRAAMDALLSQPLSLSELLWGLLTEGKSFDTPERRAGLENEFSKLTRQIPDERVRAHYLRYLRDRLNALLGTGQRQMGQSPGGKRPAASRYSAYGGGSSSLRGSKIVREGADSAPRERILVLTVLNHPELLAKVEEELAMIEFLTPELDKLRNEIIRIAVENPGLDGTALKDQLNQEGYAQLLDRIDGGGAVPPEWFSAPEAALEDAETGWKLVLKRHRQASLKKQVEEAKNALKADGSTENWEKLSALQQAVQAAEGDEANLDGFGRASGEEII